MVAARNTKNAMDQCNRKAPFIQFSRDKGCGEIKRRADLVINLLERDAIVDLAKHANISIVAR